MSRMLLVSERVVTQENRPEYVAELAERHIKASEAGANFWVFEQQNPVGRFLEFLESNSLESLNAAVTAPGPAIGASAIPATLWHEVTGP